MEAGQPPPSVDPQADIRDNKDMAALSYVWILSVVLFIIRRKSPFVRFHALQGMALFVASILFWVIPVVGPLLDLVVLGMAIFGFVGAARGQYTRVPLIGGIMHGDLKDARADWRTFVDRVAHFSEKKDDVHEMPSQPSPSSTQEEPPEPPEPSSSSSSSNPPS